MRRDGSDQIIKRFEIASGYLTLQSTSPGMYYLGFAVTLSLIIEQRPSTC